MKNRLLFEASVLQLTILLQCQCEHTMETVHQVAKMLQSDKRKEHFGECAGRIFGIQEVLPLLQQLADFLADKKSDKQAEHMVTFTLGYFEKVKEMLAEILEKIPEFKLPEPIVH